MTTREQERADEAWMLQLCGLLMIALLLAMLVGEFMHDRRCQPIPEPPKVERSVV